VVAWENREQVRCKGGRKRRNRKQDFQGGRKQEKLGKLCYTAKYFAIEKVQRGGRQQK